MVRFQSEVLMILTVILAIAVIWLGIVAVVTFIENPKEPNGDFLRFVGMCALLAFWVWI